MVESKAAHSMSMDWVPLQRDILRNIEHRDLQYPSERASEPVVVVSRRARAHDMDIMQRVIQGIWRR